MKTKLQAFDRLPKINNPANLDIFYETIIGDVKTGRLIDKQGGRCHSFVSNFLRCILMIWAGCSNTAMTDTGGTSRTNLTNSFPGVLASAADANYGSLVGTGTNPAAVTDIALQTKIAHGTSAGQLQYGTVTFGTPTTDSTSSYFVVTRVFTNGSGSTITVNEIGLASYLSDADAGSASRYILLIRDVIAARAILNGQFLTTNYLFKAIA